MAAGIGCQRHRQRSGYQRCAHQRWLSLRRIRRRYLGLEILAKSRLTLVDNTGTEKVNTGSTLELTA